MVIRGISTWDCTPQISHSSTQVQCYTPAGQPNNSTGMVAAQLQTGYYSNLGWYFKYDAPIITSITPLNGPTTGYIQLTVTGNNFGISMQVYMNDVLVANTPSGASHTSLIFTIPSGSGASNVVVRVSGKPHNQIQMALFIV
jgi:hypothetical protein